MRVLPRPSNDQSCEAGYISVGRSMTIRMVLWVFDPCMPSKPACRSTRA